MRRMISAWIALVAISAAITGTASAASWTGSIEGGASLPSGDFGSSDKLDASTGWALGGSVDYQWKPEVAFGIDGSFGQNKSGAEGSVTPSGTIDKSSFSTWSLGAHTRYFFPTPATMQVKWYGLVGAGIYGFDNSTTITSGSTSTEYTLTDKRAGMKLGLGGIYWANPKVGINGGLDYNVAFLDKDSSPSSTLQYMGAHVGVTFDIPSASGEAGSTKSSK